MYEPSADRLFGEPARPALDAVIPDGRHETDGLRPIPDGAYVVRDGRYYRVSAFATDGVRRDRTLVRVDPLGEGTPPPDDALLLDDLPRPTARIGKILHSDAVSNGASGGSDLLRDDAYVLRRLAERENRLADDELDGLVVRTDADSPLGYRLRTDRASATEPRYVTRADLLARDRATFREIVFETRVDVESVSGELSSCPRDRLDSAIRRDRYTERAPASDSFETLLAALGPTDTGRGEFTRIGLWYDETYYRCTLAVRPPE